MCVVVCLYVEPVLRSKDYVQSWIKVGSVLCLYTPVPPSVHEMQDIYMPLGSGFFIYFFFKDIPLVEFMYLVHTYQVKADVGNSEDWKISSFHGIKMCSLCALFTTGKQGKKGRETVLNPYCWFMHWTMTVISWWRNPGERAIFICPKSFMLNTRYVLLQAKT